MSEDKKIAKMLIDEYIYSSWENFLHDNCLCFGLWKCGESHMTYLARNTINSLHHHPLSGHSPCQYSAHQAVSDPPTRSVALSKWRRWASDYGCGMTQASLSPIGHLESHIWLPALLQRTFLQHYGLESIGPEDTAGWPRNQASSVECPRMTSSIL
jgi:hypothetical protein